MMQLNATRPNHDHPGSSCSAPKVSAQQDYSNRSNAIAGARSKLGKTAVQGEDFVIERLDNGRFVWTKRVVSPPKPTNGVDHSPGKTGLPVFLERAPDMSREDQDKLLKALNEKHGKTEITMPKITSPKTPAKPAGKTKGAKGQRVAYDWDKAAAQAAEGKVPALPPYKSYDVHLKDVRDLASKGDAAGLREYMKGFKPAGDNQGRQRLFDYAKLCQKAISSKAA
jgi:hypothetical protein